VVKPQEDEDVQLMLAVQRGDTVAFRRLFDKHIAGVVGYANHLVGSPGRAEELAQDVFLQVYRNRVRYVPRARFKTWLYRMVTNACLSELRRQDVRGRQGIGGQRTHSTDARVGAAAAVERSTEDALLTQEAIDRMRAALATLPSTQRGALLLARGEGFSYEEVAQALSCSVAAVKSLIHRATLALREQLREDDD
jgi:RNA polymerase sigma-70 factor (ECF subfamily)